MDHIIKAKVTDYAFDSTNQLQYCPGWEVEFNVTKGTVSIPATGYSIGFVRQLFWLRTPTGRWIFQFDRANSSDTALRLFFCKECGMPFGKLNELGTHTRENGGRCNKLTKQIAKTVADDEDAAEEQAIKEQLAKESGAVLDQKAKLLAAIREREQVGA